jgi:hypothetical protein
MVHNHKSFDTCTLYSPSKMLFMQRDSLKTMSEHIMASLQKATFEFSKIPNLYLLYDMLNAHPPYMLLYVIPKHLLSL